MSNDLRDNDYSKIYQVALLKIESLPRHAITTESISKIVTEAISFFNINNFGFKDKLINSLFESFTVQSSSSSIIRDSTDHIDWYDNSKDRPYWETYRDFLKIDEKYSINGVNDIDVTTDDIMRNIENPNREGAWDSRGMIVGSVQSGKTSNFIGLMNKAIDAGYKGIILLSGLHKNLRQQTQKRCDKGFLGYDTSISKINARVRLPIFKKRINFKNKPPMSLTNSSINGDFKTSAREYTNVITDHPILLVIKKNKTVLQNVIKYFSTAPGLASGDIIVENNPFKLRKKHGGDPPFIKNYPLLVIDDEVDNGSVDTGEQFYDENGDPNPEYNPTTINRLIRQLLHIFEKKCYIGYTATPFANIFIHDKGYTNEHGLDLFPKNFIIDLPIPENHTGLEKIFPKEVLDGQIIDEEEIKNNVFCKIVKDHTLIEEDPRCDLGWMPPKHDKFHDPIFESEDEIIPFSLREAILSFIISNAVRNLRGDINEHKTMLIHVTKYKLVQEKVFKQVTEQIERYRDTILGEDETKRQLMLDKMREIWEKNFLSHQKQYPNIKYPTWDNLVQDEKGFKWIISEISKNIKTLNSDSKDELNYDEFYEKWKYGLNTIVIGGDKLSRGLTLEGLSVSYFLRSSTMPMYDTLMQMGRWFGYRPGYEDLCRIYTTKSVIEWFFHISVATDELRSLFKIMDGQKKTPKEFGLRVRDHPILAITSKTKMRHSRIERTCYSGSGHELIAFPRKDNLIEENRKLVESILANAGSPFFNGDIKSGFANYRNSYQWQNCTTSSVINFLKKFNHFESERSHRSIDLATYIEKVNRYGELKNFTISLLGNGDGKEVNLFNKYKVNLLQRKARGFTEEKISFGVVTNEALEGIDLTKEEYDNYLKSYENYKKSKSNDKQTEKVSRNYIRYNRSEMRGSLNIYPINYFDKIDENPILVYAISISLPNTRLPEHESSIDYRVNPVYFREEDNESRI